MFAMKCDRCGSYFDDNEVKISGGNCNREKFGRIVAKGEHNFCEDYDLCDDCAVEFFKWVNDTGKIADSGGDADGQERPE